MRFKLSITKMFCGIADKTSNWQYMELLKNGFKGGWYDADRLRGWYDVPQQTLT